MGFWEVPEPHAFFSHGGDMKKEDWLEFQGVHDEAFGYVQRAYAGTALLNALIYHLDDSDTLRVKITAQLDALRELNSAMEQTMSLIEERIDAQA